LTTALARRARIAHFRTMLHDASVKSQDAAPDFRHVETWIFDLDNTLYPASSDLFEQIDAKMTAYVQKLAGLGWDDARALQKTYYRDHGTTLNGLMRNHGVDPDEFLGFVHDIDVAVLMPDADLKAAIARLPGRRYIFTNGCRDHASRVLKQLELETLFDAIWDIRAIDYRPKPDPQGYRRMLDDHGVTPARAAMFEDSARNLVPAHDLGITTVWLKNGSVWSKQGPEHPKPEPKHIHYEIEDLARFLHTIRT
jgi:putative hydrolase of the HAD superfamily